MIDTHTHIYFPEYGGNPSQLMDRCVNAGVKKFILPNVDESSLPYVKAFHASFPKNTYMAVGLHPTEVNEDWERVLDIVENELESKDYVAVGEVGIDLYWDKTKFKLQKKVFEKQLQLAQKFKLPVIIHSRDAFEETMESIEKIKPDVPLIFHSFTGNVDDVKRIRKGCDAFFGINGVITYKNAQELREALKEIGIDKIVLETDSPYLTPVPHRGKRNESSFLSFIRDKIAETLNLTPQEVELTTDRNATSIFKI